MAFKVLAVLLVACIAQNVASGAFLPRDKPNQVTYEFNTMISAYGNPLECLPQLRSLRDVILEGKTLFLDFFRLSKRLKELEASCNKLPQEDEKQECLKKVHETIKQEFIAFKEKVKEYPTKFFDAIDQIRKCLSA